MFRTCSIYDSNVIISINSIITPNNQHQSSLSNVGRKKKTAKNKLEKRNPLERRRNKVPNKIIDVWREYKKKRDAKQLSGFMHRLWIELIDSGNSKWWSHINKIVNAQRIEHVIHFGIVSHLNEIPCWMQTMTTTTTTTTTTATATHSNQITVAINCITMRAQ